MAASDRDGEEQAGNAQDQQLAEAHPLSKKSNLSAYSEEATVPFSFLVHTLCTSILTYIIWPELRTGEVGIIIAGTDIMTDVPVTFTKERHIKYFLRCLKTFLPSLYTSNDSNRMLLAFFTVAGLDLLGVLQSKTTPEERQGYIDWIYHCQVPTGGFRAFTGTDFGAENRTLDNEAWDPANVPSTFFALELLIILGDDLSRVKRRECLQWLPRLQRDNGSFGEVLGPGGKIEGGGDLRFCCFAAGTRYILRGNGGADVDGIKDIDVDKLAAFVQACQVSDLHSLTPYNPIRDIC